MVRVNSFFAMLLLGFVIGSRANSASAATITWGGAQNITANSDISTTGSYVDAIKFGTGSVTDTNGDLFNGVQLVSGLASQNGFATDPITVAISTDAAYFAGAPNLVTADANYSAILSTLGYDASTVTLHGLTNGNEYLVQIWANQTVNRNNNSATLDAGPTLLDSTVAGTADGGAGQYAIGTFFATGDSQTISVSAPGHDPILNAIMVREVVPEPTSIALLGLGAIGLCAVARRRK